MYDYYYFVAHSALGTLPHMYVLIVSCMYDFISRARDLLMLTVCTLWGCPQSACSQLSVCPSGLLYVLCPNKLVPAPTVMKQWEFVVCQLKIKSNLTKLTVNVIYQK